MPITRIDDDMRISDDKLKEINALLDAIIEQCRLMEIQIHEGMNKNFHRSQSIKEIIESIPNDYDVTDAIVHLNETGRDFVEMLNYTLHLFAADFYQIDKRLNALKLDAQNIGVEFENCFFSVPEGIDELYELMNNQSK